MTKISRSIGLLLLLLVLSASSVFADTVTFTGTTVGGPTWNRPVAGNPPVPPPSGVGTNVAYSVTQLSVGTSGSYVFQSTATTPAGWDNYTFLYQNSFNPLAQFTNVLIGNDDNPGIGLSGFTINLTAGTTYFLIHTGFDNSDAGAFSTTITGPGTIIIGGAAPVPEPATMILLGSGLAGIGLRLRKRRKV